MKYIAEIKIRPISSISDPVGTTTKKQLTEIGITTINKISSGRLFTLDLSAESIEHATQIIEDLCKKVLCNPLIEAYSFDVKTA